MFNLLDSTLPCLYGESAPFTAGLSRLENCLRDKANLHAWCSMAGYHQSFQLMSLENSMSTHMQQLIRLQREEAFRHMHCATRIINTSFQQSKDILSSTTVTAVSILVVCAAFSDELEACKTHHKGLLMLINLRGGINIFTRADAALLSR